MDDEEASKDTRYSYVDTKPTYSSCVLTGQWFNTRCETLPQSTTAIVPCVLLTENATDKQCERHLSTNQEDYSLEEFEPKLVSRDFIGGRANKYFNSKTQRASQKYMDAEKYNSNFTSLNMLVYELWPKTLKEKLEVASKNTSDALACEKVVIGWKPDRLDAFGNHTSLKRPIFKEPVCPPPTVYRRDFIPRYPKMPERAKMQDQIDRFFILMEYMVAPPYGKQVLVGNWLDRRYAFDEKGNGILPGLNPAQECERHRSLSQDTYTRDVYNGDECKRQFVDKRVRRFGNFSASTSSNVKLLDSPGMRNNFTTTNTLLYEWLPKMRLDHLKQNLPSTGHPEVLHQPDLLQSFGNLTKTRNFAEQLKNERILENMHRRQTTYGIAYNISNKLGDK